MILLVKACICYLILLLFISIIFIVITVIENLLPTNNKVEKIYGIIEDILGSIGLIGTAIFLTICIVQLISAIC